MSNLSIDSSRCVQGSRSQQNISGSFSNVGVGGGQPRVGSQSSEVNSINNRGLQGRQESYEEELKKIKESCEKLFPPIEDVRQAIIQGYQSAIEGKDRPNEFLTLKQNLNSAVKKICEMQIGGLPVNHRVFLEKVDSLLTLKIQDWWKPYEWYKGYEGMQDLIDHTKESLVSVMNCCLKSRNKGELGLGRELQKRLDPEAYKVFMKGEAFNVNSAVKKICEMQIGGLPVNHRVFLEKVDSLLTLKIQDWWKPYEWYKGYEGMQDLIDHTKESLVSVMNCCLKSRNKGELGLGRELQKRLDPEAYKVFMKGEAFNDKLRKLAILILVLAIIALKLELLRDWVIAGLTILGAMIALRSYL